MRFYLAVLCLALFAAPALAQDAEPAGEAWVDGTYILERDYLASYPENASGMREGSRSIGSLDTNRDAVPLPAHFGFIQ